jgi:hypothetical protein
MLSVTYKPFLLSVTMLNVAMLSVVTPPIMLLEWYSKLWHHYRSIIDDLEALLTTIIFL